MLLNTKKIAIKTLLISFIGLISCPAFAFNTMLKSPQSIDKNFSDVSKMIAESFLLQGNYNRAKEHFEKAVALNSENIEARLSLAAIYEALNYNQEAEAQYKQILQLDNENKKANYYYSLFLGKMGRNNESLSYVIKASSLMPYNAYINYDIGVIYAQKGDYINAVKYTQISVSYKPDFPEALNNMCFGLANIRKPSEAISYCEKSLKLQPKSAPTLDSTGFAYYGIGNYKKAVEYYLKAIELDPSLSEIYLHLADAYYKLNNNEQALQTYEKYISIEKNPLDKDRIEKIINLLKINKTLKIKREEKKK
ncbi:MAG: tetratricopeptide repeat protein [bacterium]